MRALRSRLARAADGDDGITLVELIVYSIILAFVLAIVGALLINGLTTQRDVRDRTEATNTIQNAFAAVERSVRNSGGGFIDGGGTLLVVRERIAASTTNADRWRCAGYFLDESTGDLRRVLDSTGTTTAAALAAANPATIASAWDVLLPDASRIGTTRAFGPADGALAEYSTVELSLRAATGPNQKPVELSTSAVLRPQSGSSLMCW